MDVINVLNCAAALMDLRGHSNDGAGVWNRSRSLCALEAIALAEGISRPDYMRASPAAVRALAEVIAEPPPSYLDGADALMQHCAIVFTWNDQPERSRAEVTAAMRTAAAMLKAREPAARELICA